MEETNIIFTLAVLFLSLFENLHIISPVFCSIVRESCISKPINSTCINHDTYLYYTNEVNYLLQLENEAISFIEANITNRYCRNYIRAALCATIYPPCNGSAQKLCPKECEVMLKNGECSSDTRHLTEYLSNHFNNFTINCSNSLDFSSNILGAIPCESSKCVSLLKIVETPDSCLSLSHLDPEVRKHSEYSISLSSITFKYTSESNFTAFLNALKVAVSYLPLFSRSKCLFYAAIYVYNYVFIPCNLTTGTPRPLCSKACYFFSKECNFQYTTIITYGNLIGVPLDDDCENTFNHINKKFGYPNSSKDYENDCYDFPVYTPTSTDNVGSDNITNSLACNITNRNDNINNDTIIITSTTDIMITSSITDHPSSSSSNRIDVTTVANNSASSRPAITYPIIVSSVAGALLVLCFIGCIVVLLVKRLKSNTLSQVNSPFYSYRMDADLKKQYPQGVTSNDMNLLKKEYQDLDKLLIPACKIDLTILLGQGEFGKVYKGTWMHTADNGDAISQVVAVKTIKSYGSAESLKSILYESILMKDFDHPNVLNVLGVGFNPDGGLPFIVLPYMANGDLKTYLKSKRQKATTVDYLPEEIDQNTLFDMCCQIAYGMNYLATKKIVHRDLAARNCMVGDNLNIKVADFGLARDVYIKEYYRQQSIGKLPVRWMAPEALHDKISNEKTDVWSFGITCWEVFSLGRTPYPAIPNHEILKYIDKGNRPQRPNLSTDAMYRLMLKCWEADVDSRISFKEIVAELTKEACEIHATKSSADKGYTSSMPCNVDEQANWEEPREVKINVIESSTNDDYVTIAKNSNDNVAAMPSNVVEPIIVSSEEHTGTENCTNKDYMTVMPCHKINT